MRINSCRHFALLAKKREKKQNARLNFSAFAIVHEEKISFSLQMYQENNMKKTAYSADEAHQ